MPLWLLLVLGVAVGPSRVRGVPVLVDSAWIAHRYRRGTTIHGVARRHVRPGGATLALQVGALALVAVALVALAAVVAVRRRRGTEQLHPHLSGRPGAAG